MNSLVYLLLWSKRARTTNHHCQSPLNMKGFASSNPSDTFDTVHILKSSGSYFLPEENFFRGFACDAKCLVKMICESCPPDNRKTQGSPPRLSTGSVFLIDLTGPKNSILLTYRRLMLVLPRAPRRAVILTE